MDHDRLSDRVGEDDAQRLLARAAHIDTVQGASLTLDQLRDAAREAGISPSAFDAALIEHRLAVSQSAIESTPVSQSGAQWDAIASGARRNLSKWRRSIDRAAVTRNALALVTGWIAVEVSHFGVQSISASWLAEKAADPLSMVIAAAMASRLGARRFAVVAGGLALATGVEFILDAIHGAPAVHGRDPHLAMMAVGIALAALIDRRVRRPPTRLAARAVFGRWIERARSMVAEWMKAVRTVPPFMSRTPNPAR